MTSPLPSGGATREEIAKLEVGQTTIAPGTIAVIVAAFVAALLAVPLVELWSAASAAGRGDSIAWAPFAEAPARMRSAAVEAGSQGASRWRRLLAANRALLAAFTDFEAALEDESRLGRALRPPAQALMTGALGAGNERVYPGREGWLFYRPDVEYVTGPPFLDAGWMARRVRTAAEYERPPSPDPRPAIVQFARDLRVRGIALVVVPTPVKPGVHPEKLAAGEHAGPLHNPSFGQFVEDLRTAGILVFEPVSPADRDASGPLYLATDTHWRPERMEEVAARLVGFLRDRVDLPPVEEPEYVVERLEVTSRGDTERMLDLPPGSTLYPPETVWLRRVLRPDGGLWRSALDSDVLVLGDSFTNIFSLESMGWGTSAGFAEQISYVWRRPVDRLVQNDQGAFATREMLVQQPHRLAGKRVVVWQFAERELAAGDWRVLPLTR